jgi:hypothetical protein
MRGKSAFLPSAEICISQRALKSLEPILRHRVRAVEEEQAWRAVKHFQEKARNCRSLGFARDDKKERVALRSGPSQTDMGLLRRETGRPGHPSLTKGFG